MKKHKISFYLLVLAGFFIFSGVRAEDDAYNGLFVSEVMYDMKGANSEHSDWIEIYNTGGKDIKIDKKYFGLIDENEIELDAEGKAQNCHTISEDIVFKAHEFVVLVDSSDKFEDDYPGVGDMFDTVLDLSNRGDSIRLSDDRCGSFFMHFTYKNSWGGSDNGKSLEKEDLSGKDEDDNWRESYVENGTPGVENSKKPEPKEYYQKLRLNEVLPDPNQKPEGDFEFIELYNFGGQLVDLENYVLTDGSGKENYNFPKKSYIESSGFLIVYGKDFKFSLNNSGKESVYLFDPNGKNISKAEYSGSREGLSFNFDENIWRWSKFVTPGQKNIFNNPPIVKVKKDERIYKDVPADFKASAKDQDNDKLKYVWDFGDGHKSYQKETVHTYEKAGKYKVSISVDDGSEKTTRNLNIEVKKYPSRDIDIIRLAPNPGGKDSENEWIEIRNNSKKRINLQDWSIATGWKNIYNHPIYEKFIVEPNSSRVLTRENSSFTLNNKQGKVELRNPSGKKVDSLKYESKEGVAEDEIYQRGPDKKWFWNIIGGVAAVKDSYPQEAAVGISVADSADKNYGEYSERQSMQKNQARSKVEKMSNRISDEAAEKISEAVNGLAVKQISVQGDLYNLSGKSNFYAEHYLIKYLRGIIWGVNLSITQLL